MTPLALRAAGAAFAAVLALQGTATAQTAATPTADFDRSRLHGEPVPPPPPPGRRHDRAVEDRTELAIGWRPSYRVIKLEDEDGNRVTGEDWEPHQWRVHLRHPGLFDDAGEGNLLFEYYDKDLEAEKGIPGDLSGHGMTLRGWLGFPIVLGHPARREHYADDDDHWSESHYRIVPEIGLNLNSNWGGHGSNIELPNHTEWGPMLGMNLVYHGSEDLNRIGAGVQLTMFVDEIHEARSLGDFEHGEEFRFSAFWSSKVSDPLRIELRYTYTYQKFSFNEARGGPGLGGGGGATIWHESDNAFAVSAVLGF